MKAFWAGVLTELPLMLVQFLVARIAARRWPRLRGLWYAIAFLPVLLLVSGLPGLPFRLPVPRWLVFVEYWWIFTSFAAFLVFWAIRLPARAYRSRLASSDRGRRDLLKAAAYAGAAVPFAVGLYGAFVERLHFEVNEVEVPFRDLPQDLSGLRILQISDVHLSPFLSAADLRRVVDAASELRADLVVHTGDFISSPGDPLQECLRLLGQIRTVAGAFGCNGNHEIYAGALELTKSQGAQYGIDILRGEARTLRFGSASLHIAGIDYQPFYLKGRYLSHGELLREPGAFNLLLTHNPDVFRVSGPLGFDLTLGGHTHGGQVRVEILRQDLNPARFYTPYVAGLYRQGEHACYVTRGIGSIGIPARIGAPPEITLLRLTRA